MLPHRRDLCPMQQGRGPHLTSATAQLVTTQQARAPIGHGTGATYSLRTDGGHSPVAARCLGQGRAPRPQHLLCALCQPLVQARDDGRDKDETARKKKNEWSSPRESRFISPRTRRPMPSESRPDAGDEPAVRRPCETGSAIDAEVSPPHCAGLRNAGLNGQASAGKAPATRVAAPQALPAHFLRRGAASYGALARGGDAAQREHTRQRQRRRWVQVGASAVALSLAILLAAAIERSAPTGKESGAATSALQQAALEVPAITRTDVEGAAAADPSKAWPSSGVAAEKLEPVKNDTEGAETGQEEHEDQPKGDTYCNTFADPTECEDQKVKGRQKFWTSTELRAELWKTMKALGELEIREMATHRADMARQKQEAELFDLLRKTMSHDVKKIHQLQHEMHKKHTVSFRKLVTQLSDAAVNLRNYTDTYTAKTNTRIDSVKSKHDFNKQRVLKEIADKITLVNRKIQDLDHESTKAVNGTQAYAQAVESDMKTRDRQLHAMIEKMEVDFDGLDTKEKGDWRNLSSVLQAAEEKQENDRQILVAKIDKDVGALRGDSTHALEGERADIRRQLVRAMTIVAEGIASLDVNTTNRYNGIHSAVTELITEQGLDNQRQEVYIRRLRSNFRADNAAAFRRLDEADARIAQCFTDLAAAEDRLHQEALADKAFLSAKIANEFDFRDDEAKKLQRWGGEKTKEFRNSLTNTQNTFLPESKRLQYQRNLDMQKWHGMPAVITDGVRRWRDRADAQMNGDDQKLHRMLSSRVQEAGAALRELKQKINSSNNDLETQYTEMKELAQTKNSLHERATADLEHARLLEKGLTMARLAALDGNMTSVRQLLMTVKSEVEGVLDTDRADIHLRVDKRFAETQARLEDKLSGEHKRLNDKIKREFDRQDRSYKSLKRRTNAREASLLKFSNEVGDFQKREKRKETLMMDHIDREEPKNVHEIDTLTDQLLKKLSEVKARLSAELISIDHQHAHDAAEIHSEIVTENNVTAANANSKLAAWHVKMQNELSAMATDLMETLKAQQRLQKTDFEELVGNLSRWNTTQDAENRRQRMWLERISEANQDGSGDVDDQIKSLTSSVKSTDLRLTTAGTALENTQRNMANAISTALQADLKSMQRTTFDFVRHMHDDVNGEISSDVKQLTQRLSDIQSAAASIKSKVDTATSAMSDTIESRRVARKSELQNIVNTASRDRRRTEERIEALLARIEHGKVAIALAFKSAAAERRASAEGVQNFIESHVNRSQANTSTALAKQEADIRHSLLSEVDAWSKDLMQNKRASINKSAEIEVKLKQLKQEDLVHGAQINQQLVRLASSVIDCRDDSDTAIEALRGGLAAEDLKLNRTVATITNDQQDDRTRILGLIHGSLSELRANFTAAEAAQLKSMTATMGGAAKKVETERQRLRAKMLEKEAILVKSLEQARAEQEQTVVRHQQQYVNLQNKQRRLKKRLQGALNDLEGTLRLTSTQFATTQHHFNTLQTQDFTDMDGKLTRAIASLKLVEGDLETGNFKQIERVKTKLSQARSKLRQMHAILVKNQASDTMTIKSEVSNRMAALSSNLTGTVQNAASGLQAVLDAQLSNLGSKVQGVSSSMKSAEHDLHAKMYALEHSEAAHDASQQSTINRLHDIQNNVQVQTKGAAVALAANVSQVQELVDVGLTKLQADEIADKKTMLSKILIEVASLRTAVERAISVQQTDMETVVTRSLNRMDLALTREKSTALSLQDVLDSRIRGMSQGESDEEGEWDNAVQTFKELIAQLRASAHRNNTDVHEDMQKMAATIAGHQDQMGSKHLQERALFKQESRKASNQLKGNFTQNIAYEGEMVLREFQQSAETLMDSIESRFEGPQDRERELRNKISAFADKFASEFNARNRDLNGFNSTSLHWQVSTMRKIRRFAKAVREAAVLGQQVKAHSMRRLHTLRGRLERLLARANSLMRLKAQIQGAKRQLDLLHRHVGNNYKDVGQRVANVGSLINRFKSKLNQLSVELNNDVNEEQGKRGTGFEGISTSMQAVAERANRIERGIHWEEERLRESRGRSSRAREQARPARSRSVADSDQEEVVGPIPDNNQQPEQTRPPSPAPARPILGPGVTPPPEPLPWWEYRTEVSGLENVDGKIALREGVTSGFLRGVYPVSVDGRWFVYATMYASTGDLDASIKVTYNDDERATVKNDVTSGFPCDGNKCLDKSGRYVVVGTIQGGTVEYLFEFTATRAVRGSPGVGNRMWLGAGEAAFTGDDREQPPIPSSRPQLTKVTAISAMDGKTVKGGSQGHDGKERRGYRYATEPRLTVMWGKAVVWEGDMQGGSARVQVARPPGDGYYSCVVTQPGLMAFYTKFCDISKQRKIKVGLVPVMQPGEGRLVLTWGSKPKDLDIYVLAPHRNPSQAPCEVNWRNKACHSRSVRLDLDQTQGHGPETISLENWNNGKYIVRIDEYGGNPRRSKIVAGHATVAYYAPHVGGMFQFAGSTGYIEGRVW